LTKYSVHDGRSGGWSRWRWIVGIFSSTSCQQETVSCIVQCRGWSQIMYVPY
jgi:hypothetical protein